MNDSSKPGVIDSLPHSRPHRRSDRRPPAGPAAPVDPPASEPASGALATAIQATAELAEIGLRVATSALRRIADRLPRP